MIRFILLALGILLNCSAYAQKNQAVMAVLTGMPATQTMADSVKKGFRGLSVVNEKVIWISGQRGLVGRSINGGKSFVWRRVSTFEKMDFRTLHAFDKKRAMIATAGTPAAILTTHDGGKTWSQRYFSNDSAMFFDGVGFWDNRRGLIFGDPVNGRMVLMWTDCGGEHWNPIPDSLCPKLVEGEAAFAASGTTIRTLPGGHVYIATGGAKSRLWHSRDYGFHWEVFETPIIQGEPSQGIFSMAWTDTLNGVIVGGDYLVPDDTTNNCFITHDGGKKWNAPIRGPKGYRSCVAWGVGGYFMIATGPGGTDVGRRAGTIWETNSIEGWNCIEIGGSATATVYYAGAASGFFTKSKVNVELDWVAY
ncbi:MAG: YCF48-related protein [Bacteroidia bacterium]|nr:YCF48-related protein [Bacteroidia bacterium]